MTLNALPIQSWVRRLTSFKTALKGALFLASIATSLQSSANVVSTFDSGNEDWTIQEIDSSGSVVTSFAASWSSNGGNPDGHIFSNDPSAVQGWDFVAPSKFLGNKSSSANLALSFDMSIDPVPTGSTFDFFVKLINDAAMEALWISGTAPTIAFMNYEFLLQAGQGWQFGDTSGNRAALADDFTSVLSNLSEFSIRGDFVNGDELTRLDNVVLETPDNPVPVPSTVLLICLGLAGMGYRINRIAD